jgi:hypothetical protein
MYLFYNPYPAASEGANGIWVPIVSVPWGWTASTSLVQGNGGGACGQMFTAPKPSVIPQPVTNYTPITSVSQLPAWVQVAGLAQQKGGCPGPACNNP